MTVKYGPGLDLQIALVAILKADADVKGLLGTPARIYQDVPDLPTFPYVTIGDDHNVPDLAQFLDGSEIFLDIHVWSRGPGMTECKKIGATIMSAIPPAVVLSQNRNLLVEPRNQRYLTDADTITSHGVITLRALTEPSG